MRSYYNPDTGQLEAGGFGNDPERLRQDQQRRTSALNEVVQREGLGSPTAPSRPSAPSSRPSAPSSTELLANGARGAAVSDLQRQLTQLGHNPGGVDGAFGPNTEAAVRSFQQAQGLQVDGIVGPQTQAALERAQEGARISAALRQGLGSALGQGLRPSGSNGQARSPAASEAIPQGARGVAESAGSGAPARQAPTTRPSSPQPTTSSLADVERGTGVLSEGARGQDVQELQRLLGVSADGAFGPGTRAAVANFQRNFGINTSQPGAVDRATLEALRRNGALADPSSVPGGRAAMGYQGGQPFPLTVVPAGTNVNGEQEYLRPDAAQALRRLQEAAARDGINIELTDAFRTNEEQIALQPQGNAAPPGYSNHQQGISVDFNVVDDRTYQWLLENSQRFGFIHGDSTPEDLANVGAEEQHFTYRPEFSVS